MRPSYLFIYALGISAALSLGACKPSPGEDGPPRTSYGDPVGVKLDAAAGAPALELAIAVSRGVPIDPLVPALTGVLHRAVVACPGLLGALPPSSAAQVSFKVANRKIGGTSTSGAGGDPCVPRFLDGQTLDAKGSFDVLVHLRPATQAVP